MSTVGMDIPPETAHKWQEITNLLAEILRVPAALIMKAEPPEIVVFISSESKDNPYERHERACLDTGLYCETVMRSRMPLLVPDALMDETWRSNPDVRLNMISYLGYPIAWPTGDVFGTICVLDDRANDYCKAYQTLMAQCRDVIEADLSSLVAHEARLAEEARAKNRLEQLVAERTDDLIRINAQLRQKIAEHEQAESALRKAAREIEDLYNNAPCGYHSLNEDGVYVRINETELSWLGYTREEVVGRMKITDILAPDGLPRFQQDFARLRAEGRARDLEYQLVRKDSTSLPVLLSATATKVADDSMTIRATVYDITERKRAEEALRASRELLQAIIDSSTAVIYVKDTEGRYVLVNRRHEELFGNSRASVVGKSDYDLFSREYAEAFRAFDQRVLLAGTTLESEEVAPQEDGLHTYISIKFPLRDAAGVVYAVCGISTDITERKKIEEDRALLLEQEQRARTVAEAAVRMRDEFLTIASHELYTPITSLKLAMQGLMREATRLPAGAPRLLGLAERQCQRLVRLIEDLLNVTRVQHGKLELAFEEVDLRALSQEVVERFDAELKQAGIVLLWRAEAPVVGMWDRARMDQVLTNLVLNAAKYGAGKPIEISVAAEGEKAKLVVSDRGIGIDPSRLPHIFERFERGVSVRYYGGLGLGLYISRQIVVAHGGSIRVESALGAGSAFVVELPRYRCCDRPPAGGPAEVAG